MAPEIEADGTAGDSYAAIGSTANKFFRLFGDSDGNGIVNNDDFTNFRNLYGFPGSLIFDFNNDGTIGPLDLLQFKNRWGMTP